MISAARRVYCLFKILTPRKHISEEANVLVMNIVILLSFSWRYSLFLSSAQAYFVDEASGPYKWWEIYPEAGSMANMTKTIYHSRRDNLPGTVESVVTAMKATNTHAYGARGGNKLRTANLQNFSLKLGFLDHDLVSFIDNPQQSLFQYVVPPLNRQHFGRILVIEAHIKMFRLFLQSTHEYALIFEDDVTFLGDLSHEEALSMTADAIKTFHKEKWDMLYLGFCFAANGTIERNGTYRHFDEFKTIYVESLTALCTHAYIVNRFAAKLFEVELPRRLKYAHFHGLDSLYAFFQCKYGKFKPQINLCILFINDVYRD